MTAFKLLVFFAACVMLIPSEAQDKKALARQDAQYLQRLAQGDMAEVTAGKAAAGKAQSGEVKAFADHMVKDHGKMLEEKRKMAKAKQVQLPSGPDKEAQAAMKKLESASSSEFDRAYMKQMVQDHEKALKLVKETASKAQDAELKAAAQKAAPDIEKHLEMAKKISTSLK
jgi:putative membrane protein